MRTQKEGAVGLTLDTEHMLTIVQELKDRQDILDVITRYCRAMDRFDRDLLLSCYHPDAVDDHGKFLGGPEEFWDWAHNQHLTAHLSHLHTIANHTCEIEGDVAHTETYYVFGCMNREGPVTAVSGGRYIDRLERRESEWKISYRICTRDWALMEDRPDFADLSTFTSTRWLLSEEKIAFMNAGFAPKRDKTDASYSRPLTPDPERKKMWDALSS